jgi:hypothetical protein
LFVEVWVASLDLEKAFDKVYHASVIACLSDAGVDSDLVQILWSMYRKQTAYVSMNGAASRIFDIIRGVRQGDPMSPILFNNVTRVVYKHLKAKWRDEGHGTVVCGNESTNSTHAMFADDTTLFASSKQALVAMIRDVRDALAQHGLNMNMGKCMIQTSSCNHSTESVDVDGEVIPVVEATDGFKVLGTQFTLHGRTSVEIKARMTAAWAKFHTLWPLLGKRDGNMVKRLQLFDSSVTQTALWCNESWLPTAREKRLLTSTQNQMLRRIAGPHRKPDEPWIDWIKRATRIARAAAKNAGIRFWLEDHFRSKWCWAGHVARMSKDRLAHRSMQWRDSQWWRREAALPVQARKRRPRKTHWFRWEDELRRYADHRGWTCWKTFAQQRDVWHQACESFIAYSRK